MQSTLDGKVIYAAPPSWVRFAARRAANEAAEISSLKLALPKRLVDDGWWLVTPARLPAAIVPFAPCDYARAKSQRGRKRESASK